MFVRYPRDRLDVEHLHMGVGWCFEENCFDALLANLFHGIEVGEVGVYDVEIVVAGVDVAEQPIGSTIQVFFDKNALICGKQFQDA